jgi:hypothetical protein
LQAAGQIRSKEAIDNQKGRGGMQLDEQKQDEDVVVVFQSRKPTTFFVSTSQNGTFDTHLDQLNLL